MPKKSSAWKPLVQRVNTIIVLSLIIGIGIVIASLAAQLIYVINIDTRENAEDKGAITKRAVETVMLQGQANLAVEFLKRIRESELGNTVQIYRTDGKAAFSDSLTRDAVNSYIGFEKFTHQSMIDTAVKDMNYEYLARVLNGPEGYPADLLLRETKTISVQNLDGSTKDTRKQYLTLYTPLINGPNCIGCHSEQPTFRGVIGVSYDISHINERQLLGIIISIALLILMVSGLAVILSRFMRLKILSPVKQIGDVCIQVTQGDFSPRVDIENKDEIGILGDTVNTMVEGLHERFELSKYVSSSTIASLRKDDEAKKTGLTMFFSDVRGFTSYSETRQADTVVNHLNGLINLQTEIIHENNGDIDKYVGDEVVAIFSNEGQALEACRSALEIQKKVNSSDKFDNLKVGIGINTGEVILGRIGSEKRADFTVIGDNVNIAARLCGAAKAGQIFLSESSYKLVMDKIETEGPFKLSVKGKADALKVYLLKGIRSGV